MNDLRVLLVEDDPEARKEALRYLQSEGLSEDQVTVSERGDVGLEQVLSGEYDLALVDLTLPGVSGADVVRAAHRKGMDAYLLSNRTPMSTADARLCQRKDSLPALLRNWFRSLLVA